jgi:WD40 repeat protein
MNRLLTVWVLTLIFWIALSIPNSVEAKINEALQQIQTITLDNIEQLTVLLTFEVSARVYDLAFSPSGNLLASSHEDGVIQVWNLETGMTAFSLVGHSDAVWSLVFSLDGRMLISASLDHTIRAWDVESGETIWTNDVAERVMSLAVSPDGETVAAGTDGEIKLLNLETGQEQTTLQTGLDWGIWSLDFEPSGHVLASSYLPGVIFWDLSTGENLYTYVGEAYGEATNIVLFSSDGRILASKSDSGFIRLWDLESERQIHVQQGHALYTNAMAIAPNSEVLIAGGIDGTLFVWNAKTGVELTTLKASRTAISALAFSDEGTLFVVADETGVIKIWGIRSTRSLQ